MHSIASLYKEFGPMVLRRCRKLLKDEDSALDAMQDVFIKVLQKKKYLQSSGFSSLLFRIATNICIDKIRKKKRISVISDEKILLNIADNHDFEFRILIREFLDKIFYGQKDSIKQMAIMYYVDKMTLQEVAKELGISISGVRKRLRVLKQKSVLFKGQYYEKE